MKLSIYKNNKRLVRLFCTTTILAIVATTAFGQKLTATDSLKLLNKVTVTGHKKQNTFTTPVPVQALNNETLQQLNATSVGDAAQYFSGVLIKDYGGIGGLKTISVRGLGASSAGVMYDGINVADAQSGQIDLSKFSSTFVQSLELDQTNPQQILLPARAYSSSAILAITTNAFNTINFTQKKWEAGIAQGSFGLWQPHTGFYSPISKSVAISANAEAVWDKGDYPFYIPNGRFSPNAYRTNSDIKSFQGEVNIVKQFADSSLWQTKLWAYSSARGLPGAVLFLNPTSSVQRLWDKDFYVQSRYKKKIANNTSLLISTKYSSLFTRYLDTGFHNNVGGQNFRYTQQEVYLSVAVSHQLGKYISMSVASDIASTTLNATTYAFEYPTRVALWNSFSIQYNKTHWQVNASLLNTNVNDKTKIGTPEKNVNKFTPTIAASYKPNALSPFMVRFFYKGIFRMPTFNDLYYVFISSTIPNVQPEYSNQYNTGVTYSKNFNSTMKQFSISVDGYYNRINNKIIAAPSTNLFIWTVSNIGKVNIKGVDITSEANGKLFAKINWTARVAYTLQQAINADPTTSEYKSKIPYAPDNSGSGIATIKYEKWSVGYSMLFSGYRYTSDNNSSDNRLPEWITHDVVVSRNIKLHSLQANIKAAFNNIFDERYAVVVYYPMPGRSYKISITFNNL